MPAASRKLNVTTAANCYDVNEIDHVVVAEVATSSPVQSSSSSSSSYDASFWYPIHVAVLSFMMVAIVVGNVLMIACIVSNRRLWKVTNAFVVSLSLSDLLVGLFVIPVNFAVPTALLDGYTTCILASSFTVVVCLLSMSNIFAVTVDRYITAHDNICVDKNQKIYVALLLHLMHSSLYYGTMHRRT